MLTITGLQETCANEQVLMVLIARLYFKTQSSEEVQFFIDNNTIDWQLFYRIVRAHQVAAFMYSVIVSENLRIVESIELKLKKHTLTISLNSLHQLKFVQHLQEEFQRLNIQAIPYKGVYFASRYYQSLAQRESSDIDFLVSKTSVQKLRNYFREKGYVAETDVPDDYLPYTLRTSKELSFKTPPDALNINCSVEIQWQLLEGFIGDYLNFTELLPQLTEYTVAGSQQKALTPTYELLCIISHHIIKEPFIKFKYLVDIAAIMQTNDHGIEKPVVLQVLKQYGYWNAFLEGSGVIDNLLGIQVFPVNAAISKHTRLQNNAIAFPTVRKTGRENVKAMLLISNLQDSWRGSLNVKLKTLLYWILPSIEDINMLKLPLWCLPLLFLLRPFRLLYKHVFSKGRGL